MKYFYYIERRQPNLRYLGWSAVAFFLAALLFIRGHGKLDYALSGMIFGLGLLLFVLSVLKARIKKLPVKRERIEEVSG